MFIEDGSFVRDDDVRPAALSPAYSCLGCHNDDPNDPIPEKELEQAATQAVNMHSPTFISQPASDISLGVYPNPSRGNTNITYTLVNSESVTIVIYNAAGQSVFSLNKGYESTGTHSFLWNGTSNTGASIESGYYFIQVTAGKAVSAQKLVIMK